MPLPPTILKRLYGNHIERVENIAVQLTMQGNTYNTTRDHINEMGATGIGIVHNNDTVTIDYQFTITYFNVVRQLQALTTLLKHPAVTSAVIGERDQLDSVLLQMTDAIRDVQERLK